MTAPISTSHVERINPGLRLFDRCYTRLTMDFSKTSEIYQPFVVLFIFTSISAGFTCTQANACNGGQN
jgi:hypothetical protein